MRVVRQFAAATAAMLILLAPALWNRFPLLEYDTGGYLARWYEGTLAESRSTVYGLFLNLLTYPDFWPAIIVQAALTLWVLALLLRVYNIGASAGALLVTVAGLSLLTALPWLADVLLTDAYAGLAVLALHLMVMQAHALRHWERVGLFALVAFAAATHGGTFMTILVLLGAGFVVALFGRKMISLARLGEGLLALAFSAALLFATDYVVTGELAWTPGGIGLAFGRMLQDGIVARYLGDHCPDPKLRLCDHRAELHLDADKFFWGESVFNQLGRFKGMDTEMRTIVLGSMADYPGLQMRAAMEDWVSQLVHVRTGYGINAQIWHTYGIIERFVPAASPAMKAARQQGGQLGTVFDAVNRVHVPVAFAAMVLLLGVAALGLVQPRFADLGWLASTVMVAILANALLFGTLSGPHDRYGARLAFLAPLVLLMLPWRVRRMSNSAHIK